MSIPTNAHHDEFELITQATLWVKDTDDARTIHHVSDDARLWDGTISRLATYSTVHDCYLAIRIVPTGKKLRFQSVGGTWRFTVQVQYEDLDHNFGEACAAELIFEDQDQLPEMIRMIGVANR